MRILLVAVGQNGGEHLVDQVGVVLELVQVGVADEVVLAAHLVALASLRLALLLLQHEEAVLVGALGLLLGALGTHLQLETLLLLQLEGLQIAMLLILALSNKRKNS